MMSSGGSMYAGFRRSSDTFVCLLLTMIRKCLSFLLTTLYGPSYGRDSVGLMRSFRINTYDADCRSMAVVRCAMRWSSE